MNATKYPVTNADTSVPIPRSTIPPRHSRQTAADIAMQERSKAVFTSLYLILNVMTTSRMNRSTGRRGR